MFFFREIKRSLKNALNIMNPDTQAPAFKLLDSQEELDNLLSQSEQEPVVLFKHSLTCGVSAMAHRRLTQLNEPEDPVVYKLEIQNNRPLSNHVAQHFGIKHESPQVIIVHKGSPVFDTSHGRITPASVRDAIASAQIS